MILGKITETLKRILEYVQMCPSFALSVMSKDLNVTKTSLLFLYYSVCLLKAILPLLISIKLK